ncbi:MAG: glycoside hydrolase family 130 protein [Phycisphaerae bacterium]|nr:glycoside hydrolase family 130 protein [Phycisphaerae bacterium]
MTEPVIGKLKTSPIVTRYPGNPILSHKDVPYPATLVFNAGVTKFQGRYVMVFRNDVGRWDDTNFDGTNLGLAFSDDGIEWQVQPKPCMTRDKAAELTGASYANRGSEVIVRGYDPRLTVIDGRCYMCFAVDTMHGIRGGIAVTDDFENFELLSLTSPDNRNMVLFPEKVSGKYVRLERPFPVYSRGGAETFDLWISDSPDMKYWGNCDLVLGVEDVPFSNGKIGPGAPPIKTDKGWLTLFHATDVDPSRGKNGWEARWQKRYTIGVMLLDLEDPRKLIGMSKQPLMAPEAPYETEGGFRNNVLFPGGMILENDGEVKIYYGAADTVECLATADVDDLLALCL